MKMFPVSALAMAVIGCAPVAEDLQNTAVDEPPMSVSPSDEAPIEQWIHDNFGLSPGRDVVLVEADFDADGKRDWLVYLQAPKFCGTGGCTLYAVRRHGGDWEQIGRMPVARPPIGLLGSKTNGHYDIFVGVGGGGGPVGTARVPFVGGQYGPSTTASPAEMIYEPAG